MARTRTRAHWSHGTGQSYTVRWTPEKVAEAPDPALAFAEYAQQVLGVPWATLQDHKILRKEINTFFERYPHLDYFTLCRVVQWCAKKNWRVERVWKIVACHRMAWRDGFIPELKPPEQDENIEARIRDALKVETSPDWRICLLGAVGQENRRDAIREWEARRG